MARPLVDELPDFEVSTVRGMGWAGFKNGALIDRAAELGIDRIFTVDQRFGANYSGELPLGIVVLIAGTLNPDKLKDWMPRVAEALRAVDRGEIRFVTPDTGT